MKHVPLIITGSVATDKIMTFNGVFSEKIHKESLGHLSVSILIDSYETAFGGTGGNIAFGAASLGMRPILAAAIGKSDEEYQRRFKVVGVDTVALHKSALPTAVFSVLSDSEGNQIGGFYPGAMTDASKISLSAIADKNALVIISADDPAAMRKHVTEASTVGCRLIYDPGQQVTNIDGSDLLAGINAAEIVIVNEYEKDVLIEKTNLSEEQLLSTPKTFVLTKGRHGSDIYAGSEAPIHIPIVNPKSIVDPTGAGDAYRVGFLYGLVRQWGLEKCGQLGAVLATIVLEQSTAQVPFEIDAVSKSFRQAFNQDME